MLQVNSNEKSLFSKKRIQECFQSPHPFHPEEPVFHHEMGSKYTAEICIARQAGLDMPVQVRAARKRPRAHRRVQGPW